MDSGRIKNFQSLGDIRIDELGLEVARRRGDDNGRIVRPRPEDRGDKIRERLADARSRLDHQVLTFVEGADNRAGHVDLPGTFLVAGHRSERPTLPKVQCRGLDIKA